RGRGDRGASSWSSFVRGRSSGAVPEGTSEAAHAEGDEGRPAAVRQRAPCAPLVGRGGRAYSGSDRGIRSTAVFAARRSARERGRGGGVVDPVAELVEGAESRQDGAHGAPRAGAHAGGEDVPRADGVVREQRPHDRRADRVTDLLVEEVLERERPPARRLVARVEGRLGLEALERLDDARRVRDRLPVE